MVSTLSNLDEMDLETLAGQIAGKLISAHADRSAAWRIPVFASMGADGPEARSVVLRDVRDGGWLLQIHTDLRSAKIAAIASEPRVEMCFWDPASSEQLRCRGHAEKVADADRVADIWRDLPVGSRLPYLFGGDDLATPGQAIGHPRDALPNGKGPNGRLSREETEIGRDVFAVIEVRVRSWDWLHIVGSGQRRARFETDRDGTVSGCWLVP